MRREEWLIGLLVGSAAALGVIALFLMLRSDGVDEAPGPEQPRRRPPDEIRVWVGELQEGVVGVLGPVWGDPSPDRSYEGSLNDDLGLQGDAALGYCRLLVFNTTKEARTLSIRDKLLEIVGTGGRSVPLRSLAAMAARGEVTIPEGLEFRLRAVGILQESVRIPPDSMVNLVVPFAQPTPLAAASAVQTAKGSALRARPIPRGRLQALMQSPDERELERLIR